jgi:hypothetical protein
VRYAKLERRSATVTALTVSLNVAFGLGLVALEVLIAHDVFAFSSSSLPS